MIDCSGIMSVKTLHCKKVVILAKSMRTHCIRTFEYRFTDDDCAFAFQAEVEMAMH
jgi:hypothetical protein